MNAILWDGHKQLHGYLEFGETGLIFRLKDFSETSLHLVMKYVDIASVGKYKLYNLSNEGIEIISKDGKRNVFVVEEVAHAKKDIMAKMHLP